MTFLACGAVSQRSCLLVVSRQSEPVPLSGSSPPRCGGAARGPNALRPYGVQPNDPRASDMWIYVSTLAGLIQEDIWMWTSAERAHPRAGSRPDLEG